MTIDNGLASLRRMRAEGKRSLSMRVRYDGEIPAARLSSCRVIGIITLRCFSILLRFFLGRVLCETIIGKSEPGLLKSLLFNPSSVVLRL